MLRLVSLVFGFALLSAHSLSGAQSTAPVLDPAHGLDTYVTGQASADSGRVVVYDMFYPARTKLGEGVVNVDGRFGISVKLPLQEGHAIVVEDSLQRVSTPIIVQVPRSGPTAAQGGSLPN